MKTRREEEQRQNVENEIKTITKTQTLCKQKRTRNKNNRPHRQKVMKQRCAVERKKKFGAKWMDRK